MAREWRQAMTHQQKNYLEFARSKLEAALMQCVPTDDPIIIGHIRDSVELIDAALCNVTLEYKVTE